MEMSVDEALKKGIEAHQTGRLEAADKFYTAILNLNPKHPGANHNIGILAADLGKFEQALQFFQTALDSNSGIDLFWQSYIRLLIRLKRLDDARSALSKARKSVAKAEVFYQLGLSLDELEKDSRSGQPPDQVNDLIILFNKGQFTEVLSKVEPMLASIPSAISLLNIQGACYAALERYDLAIDSYKKALKIKPDYAEAYNNLGNAFRAKIELDAALESYKQAIKIRPAYADAHFNRGNVLRDRGNWKAAIDSYEQAIQIKPDWAEPFYFIGISQKELGEPDAALRSYKRALKIKPTSATTLNSMGIALFIKGDIVPALDCYKRAVTIKPDFAFAYYNMGNAQHTGGEITAAIESYKKALEINPYNETVLTQKLHQQSHICDWAAIQSNQKRIPKLGLSNQIVDIWGLLSLEDAPERHRLRAENYVKRQFNHSCKLIHAKPKTKPFRLRIGYFSGDFQNHPAMYLMVGILAAHDRNKFEIYAYSYGPDSDDDMRHRAVASVDVFKEVREMTDPDLAILARHDKIDIAIDLSGHTRNSRTGIFAHSAAPVQINYLGYPGTLGADFIDYIVADKRIIPDGSEDYFSEKIIYMPHTYYPTDNKMLVSGKPITREKMGLPEKSFVFCCFNKNYKITMAEFDIWMRLLSKVQNSVLWLLKSNPWAEGNLKKAAVRRGIAQDRLVFAQKLPQAEHLARHRLADLFLDIFNFNAHTTASDAL